MKRIPAASDRAAQALELVETLQARFVRGLESLAGDSFSRTEWFRDGGLHGGGSRYGIEDNPAFGRASVNVSQVHYDDEPGRRLGSASALSAIVHPTHPLAPSVHIHISWTETKAGEGYWRLMADLNPSQPDRNQNHTTEVAEEHGCLTEGREARKDGSPSLRALCDLGLEKTHQGGCAQRAIAFKAAMQAAAPERFEVTMAQGDRYFFIPALGRPRGVAHFYLEEFNTGDFAADLALAKRVGEAAIDTYLNLLGETVRGCKPPTEAECAAQLAYHTLYFFQVLTLDRGTTTGLMVHDQNDVGILGSLPGRIDKNLLASWRSRMVPPQERLLDALLAALPRQGVCTIDDPVKLRLAAAVRAHYTAHPEALALQASGTTTPPTVDNHR